MAFFSVWNIITLKVSVPTMLLNKEEVANALANQHEFLLQSFAFTRCQARCNNVQLFNFAILFGINFRYKFFDKYSF